MVGSYFAALIRVTVRAGEPTRAISLPARSRCSSGTIGPLSQGARLLAIADPRDAAQSAKETWKCGCSIHRLRSPRRTKCWLSSRSARRSRTTTHTAKFSGRWRKCGGLLDEVAQKAANLAWTITVPSPSAPRSKLAAFLKSMETNPGKDDPDVKRAVERVRRYLAEADTGGLD